MDNKWAYLAGIVDGEGCFCIGKTNSHKNHTLAITVTNTNIQLIIWLKDNFGGHITVYKTKNEKYKTSYKWQFTKASKVKCILEKILPHLIVKKEQAMIALEFGRTVGRGGRKTSPEVINYRETLRQNILKLNKRGKVA